MIRVSSVSIEEVIGNLDDSEIALLLVPSSLERDLTNELVTHFTTAKDALCVYVSVSQPSKTVDKRFEAAGAETDNIFYIDCATKLTGISEFQRAGNTVFLHPQDLTTISISLSKAIESIPEGREGILVFDTLSTLMIYNDADTVSRFAHSLTSNIREWGIKSIVLTLEEETDDVIKARLTQFTDVTINVDEL